MNLKNILLFCAAVLLSLVAAKYRFNDSAHSIGLIKAGGGEARHPAVLADGYSRYTLIATAAVIPPYRGDARVAVEGLPEMDATLYSGDPAIDLSPYPHPTFHGDTFYGLQPRDRIALWVVLKPKTARRAMASAVTASPPASSLDDCCLTGGELKPAAAAAATAAPGRPQLAFYDVKSGQRLLNVPIVFRGEGGSHDHSH